MMRAARAYGLAAVAAVALTGLSVAAVAATNSAAPGAGLLADCEVPAVPGHPVTVLLRDMPHQGMMGSSRGGMELLASPRTVPAGTVSLVAVNRGSRTHELLVVPLAAGVRAGQQPVDAVGSIAEDGSLGEASRTCGPSTGDGVAPRSAGWITLTLRPGRYELLCNLPGHYAAGMFGELDVSQGP